MRDERIAEYLRSRGRAQMPPGFSASVMEAVDRVPMQRYRFSPFLPAFAAVGAVALVAVLAILLGQARNLGPGPEASPSPSTAASRATIDELSAELAEAVSMLRAAPAVEGRQEAYLREHLGTATWFDWRANGDQVVVQRQDLDVTQTGWWMDPAGEPPASGANVVTNVWVFAGDSAYFGGPEGWQSIARDEAPPVVAYGPGILSGEIEPTEPLRGLVLGLPSMEGGVVERVARPDGRVGWRLEAPWRDGTVVQEWLLGPDGVLESWTWQMVGTTPDPDSGFNGNLSLATLEFQRVDDPDPMPAPDLDAPPDPGLFGLPADFPLD